MNYGSNGMYPLPAYGISNLVLRQKKIPLLHNTSLYLRQLNKLLLATTFDGYNAGR